MKTKEKVKHTPEPWKLVEHSWSDTGIYGDERPGYPARIAGVSIRGDCTEETQAEMEEWMAANCNRIVSAVNAFEGIEEIPEGFRVKELVEAAEAVCEMNEEFDAWLATQPEETQEQFSKGGKFGRLRAALAKLK